MRELQLKKEDKLEVKAEFKKESQTVLQGTIKPQRGQIIFEICLLSELISEAKFQSSSVEFTKAVKGDFSGCNQLLIKDGHIYIPAINKENALKKFKQNKNQEFYFKKDPILNL
jgi:hypothetical protein